MIRIPEPSDQAFLSKPRASGDDPNRINLQPGPEE